jgi:hypothetical protein
MARAPGGDRIPPPPGGARAAGRDNRPGPELPAATASSEAAAVVRPFAAAFDTQEHRLRFLSPSVPAGGGVPASRPEQIIFEAVRELLSRLLDRRFGGAKPAIPSSGTRPRYLHLSGRASALAVGDPLCFAMIATYLDSAAKGGEPGHGIEIRAGDAGRIAVVLSAAADPALPAAPQPEPAAVGTMPAGTVHDLLRLRRSLIPDHQGVVAAVQQFLEHLAGKRGQTLDENRSVAAAVNALADDYGVALLYDRQPVALRVVPLKGDAAGSFQVRLTGSDQKALKTSMAFPQLVAVSKAALTGGVIDGSATSAEEEPASPKS